MKIVFTAHARKKFAFFRRHKVIIYKKQVGEAIEKGKIIDTSDFPKIQTAGFYNDSLSLIVIYKKESGIPIVITFWVAQKGRYENNLQ